ncbi:MAG: 3-hydroxyacyl-CoA dehydrogenase family protein [Candidatus Limnocylindrales bacterium]
MSAAVDHVDAPPATSLAGLTELLRSIADDEFVIGFSDSEWTTAIGDGSRRPVIGLHFFNPVPVMRLLEEGAASVEAIDTALRDAGFPMGPFELMDLIGIDVNLAAATAIWEGLGRPDRLRPSPIQEQLVADGHLGRKTGRGFYHYIDGRRAGVALAEPGALGPQLSPATIQEPISASIADEARLAAEAGVARPADIQLALRLGAGHPERL